jgi:hypothetical protein
MKVLVGILIVAAAVFVGWRVYDYWDQVNTDREAKARAAAPRPVVPEQLDGLPRQLEPSLQEARKQGVAGLRAWLERYKSSRLVKDPRLAWIELDYVVLVSAEDPVEAKRLFAEVKKRTPPESPVTQRIKELARTYE